MNNHYNQIWRKYTDFDSKLVRMFCVVHRYSMKITYENDSLQFRDDIRTNIRKQLTKEIVNHESRR